MRHVNRRPAHTVLLSYAIFLVETSVFCKRYYTQVLPRSWPGFLPYSPLRPRRRAKARGTPNSLIVTWGASEAPPLRAKRSCQSRRYWARIVRERMSGDEVGGEVPEGSRWTSTRW